MGEFFVYILKSSICLALFYLFYRLLLSKETFYRLNRMALLGLIVFSMTIPFFKVMTEPVAIQRPVQNLEYLIQMVQEQTSTDTPVSQAIGLEGLLLVYICGVVFFLIKYIYSTYYISRLVKRGEKKLLPNGVTLVLSAHQVSPFSWMRYIVISRQDIEKSEDAILSHEMAHLKAYHSIDLLIVELCVIIQWFNPAAWLLKRELQNIHEYEADESVLNQGVDARNYQLLLIGRAVGSRRFRSIVNSFNHSKLKKRITMMLKRKSTPWARMKYLYVLPLAAFTIVAFSRPEVSLELEKISNVKMGDASIITKVRMDEKADTTKVLSEINRKEAKKTKKKEKALKVKADRTRKKELAGGEKGEIRDVETTAALSDSISNNGALFPDKRIISLNYDRLISGPNINDSTINITNKAKVRVLSVRPGQESHPLILVDGVERAPNILQTLDPSTIESFSILKDETATNIYGAKARGGVVIIVTKKNEDFDSLKLDKK